MLHGTLDFCARIPTPIVGPSNSTLLFWDWWVLMTLVTPLCTSLIQAQPAFPCHSGVTVARRNRHYLASMQPAKIWFSRVKTVLDSIWQQSEPEFVMRRSGVRFISPAPFLEPAVRKDSGFFNVLRMCPITHYLTETRRLASPQVQHVHIARPFRVSSIPLNAVIHALACQPLYAK